MADIGKQCAAEIVGAGIRVIEVVRPSPIFPGRFEVRIPNALIKLGVCAVMNWFNSLPAAPREPEGRCTICKAIKTIHRWVFWDGSSRAFICHAGSPPRAAASGCDIVAVSGGSVRGVCSLESWCATTAPPRGCDGGPDSSETGASPTPLAIRHSHSTCGPPLCLAQVLRGRGQRGSG